MSVILPSACPPWLPPILAVLALLSIWLLYRLVRSRKCDLETVLADISYDRLDGLVIPSADEGEIVLDYLLLTSRGLLILEVRDVRGVVFGGDKMQEWTVISDERRYTFPNPQPALYDRIAAVRQIVRQVPVAGRILFLDGADFTKGVPGLVCSLSDLRAEFSETNKAAAKIKIEAFMSHWELIARNN